MFLIGLGVGFVANAVLVEINDLMEIYREEKKR